MSRTSKEKDAISMASSLEWQEAKDFLTSPDMSKGHEIDYETILPSLETVGSSLGVSAVADTVYEEELATKPVVNEIVVKGKDIKYYSTEQCNQNLLLKAAVAETEELLTTLHQLQEEQVSNSRALLAERNQNRKARVKEFDSGYRWAEPSDHTARSLVGDLKLNVTVEEVATYGEISHPQLIPVASSLEDLLHENHTTAKKNQMQETVEGIMLAYLQNCDSKTTGHLFSTSLKLHDLIHTDVLQYIKGELATSGDKMKVYLEELGQVEIEQEEAQQAEDILKIDTSHQAAIDILERLIGCIRNRLSQIRLGGNDTGTYRGKFEQYTNEGGETLKELRTVKEQLKGQIMKDLEVLATHGENEAQKNARALSAFSEQQKESNLLLQEYAKQQDDIWAKIELMVSEVKLIGDKRAVEVMCHLKATEEEEKRKREYAEFSEVFADHCRLMEDLLKHTETSLKMLGHFGDYFKKGSDLINSKDVEDEFQDIRVLELKRYLEFFRRFSLKTNDLLFKRKARLAGIKRLVRNAEAQLQFCQESLDPHKNKYKEELVNLSRAETDIKDQLGELARRLRKQEEDFKPTEDLLEEMNVDFTPPGLENKELETHRRQILLKLSKAIVGKEQDEVDKEATDLRKLNTDMKLGKEIILKKRESRKRQAVRK